ncbi:unnamed protein product [Ranitomeya imitator]|uniref:non-specific serine/threonine protein kinase n=1 Tax=Ranitomeya imitator TaxID=111125 RepID=A0ABN9LE89_9NEOB|nr:unnamed protein product [Ranitomeya imitator]
MTYYPVQVTWDLIPSDGISLRCSWAASFLSDLFALLNSYYCFWGLPESSRELLACSGDFLRVLDELLHSPEDANTIVLTRGLECLMSLSESTSCGRPDDCALLCQSLLSVYIHALDKIIERSQPTGPGGFVSLYISGQLLSDSGAPLFRFLSRLRHFPCVVSQLKVLYACCHASLEVCQLLASCSPALQDITFLINGEVHLWDAPRVHAAELSLLIISLLVLRLQCLPVEILASKVAVLPLLSCDVPSLLAAASILAVSLHDCGESITLSHDVLLSTLKKSLSQVPLMLCSTPMSSGLYDWTFHLLLQQLSQDPQLSHVLADESAFLWQSVCLLLRFSRISAPLEGDTPREGKFQKPQWRLLSACGLVKFLHLALITSVQDPGHFFGLLGSSESLVLVTLARLVHPGFLDHVIEACQVSGWDGLQTLLDIASLASQLLCVPLSLDVSSETLHDILQSLRQEHVVASLLQVCSLLPEGQVETPVCLIGRLALMDEEFLQQFSSKALSSQDVVSWLRRAVWSGSGCVVIELLTLFSHLIRSSLSNSLVQLIIGDCDALLHQHLQSVDPEMRSAACSLAGNLSRLGEFLSPSVTENLVDCLSNPDARVRRSAAFAVGNCVFHRSCSGDNFSWVSIAASQLLILLRDPQVKIRVHAATALGNLGSFSGDGADFPVLQMKVPKSLLHAACTDPEEPVRLASVIALRSLSGISNICQKLRALNAGKKLSASLTVDTPSSSRTHSLIHHCHRLLQQLALDSA